MAKQKKRKLSKPVDRDEMRQSDAGRQCLVFNPKQLLNYEFVHPDFKFANPNIVSIAEHAARPTEVLVYFDGHGRSVAIEMDGTGIALSAGDALPRYQPSLILDLLLPHDRAQDLHANLGELYPIWIERHGLRKANLVRRCQIAWLIGGAWWEKLLTTGERLLKACRIVGS